MSDEVTRIDIDGDILLIRADRKHRYRLIKEKRGQNEWVALIRDDGCRLHSMWISDPPTNEPRGERDWELMWEYKRCEAPGYQSIVEAIMTGTIDVIDPEIAEQMAKDV